MAASKNRFNTYLSQVRRLRQFATEALKLYAIRPASIHFINHAENATFRITSSSGQKYLLRIARNDYHSKAGIKEELRWLSQLSKHKKVTVPIPVRSRRGHVVESMKSNSISGSRNFCLFKWIDGRFLDRRFTEEQIYKVGELLGDLQNHALKRQTKHRPNWSSEGLLGRTAKFGSIDRLKGITPQQQKQITRYRRLLLKKLRAYERRFPERLGLIHADLHFGNLLWLKSKKFAAIDFDDCGFGFYAYDLVTPVISIETGLGKRRKKDWPRFRAKLIEGYKSQRPWDHHDDQILNHLLNARSLLMLGWINSRSDNPRIIKLLKPRVRRILTRFAKDY